MNHIVFMGRLARDPKLKHFDNGTKAARFTIALDRGKDKDGNSRGADFPSCVAFGKTAENLVKYSGKGLRVMVQAHVHTGSYDDKETGETVFTQDLVADRVQFIDWAKKDDHSEHPGLPDGIPEGFQAIQDDDIPF